MHVCKVQAYSPRQDCRRGTPECPRHVHIQPALVLYCSNAYNRIRGVGSPGYMESEAPLNGRLQEILQSIVRAYIETGEPVGSRTIAKSRGTLSPASIRNVMADLADDGYLSQPHTSAGRVPTEKAFRLYVQSL